MIYLQLRVQCIASANRWKCDVYVNNIYKLNSHLTRQTASPLRGQIDQCCSEKQSLNILQNIQPINTLFGKNLICFNI